MGGSFEIDREELDQINFEDSSKLTKPTTSSSIEIAEATRLTNSPENESAEYNFSLTEEQINALKSIRTRNSALFKVNQVYSTNSESNTTLEKQSKLSLAPANLIKFV